MKSFWRFSISILDSFHHPNAARSSRLAVCRFSGIDKIAEDKIQRWLKEGGAQEIRRHQGKLSSDPHQHVARSLNLHDDYLHSKILADNKILPKSIELRQRLDKDWEVLRADIRRAWSRMDQPSLPDFLKDPSCLVFQERMNELHQLSKRVNSAIISDSMLFRGGRSPVRHARGYKFEERVAEVLHDSKHKNAVLPCIGTDDV